MNVSVSSERLVKCELVSETSYGRIESNRGQDVMKRNLRFYLKEYH
jgi:hypothetical protein